MEGKSHLADYLFFSLSLSTSQFTCDTVEGALSLSLSTSQFTCDTVEGALSLCVSEHITVYL